MEVGQVTAGASLEGHTTGSRQQHLRPDRDPGRVDTLRRPPSRRLPRGVLLLGPTKQGSEALRSAVQPGAAEAGAGAGAAMDTRLVRRLLSPACPPGLALQVEKPGSMVCLGPRRHLVPLTQDMVRHPRVVYGVDQHGISSGDQ